MGKYILTLTPNPSIDKTAVVERYLIGRIHRPQRLVVLPGGKGVNVARSIKILGGPVCAGMLLGGHAGKWILEQLEKENIPCRAVWSDGETRSCLSVIDGSVGTITELYEAGTQINGKTWNQFEKLAEELLPHASFVTMSGSLPIGAPGDAYARLVRLANKHRVPAFIDASGKFLREAIAAEPYMVKINQQEAGELLGLDLQTTKGAISAVKKIRDSCEIAIITLGRDGAVMAAKDEVWHLQPPKITSVSSVGSGDALLGAFCVGLERGDSVIDALQLGIAAGAANALEIGPGLFKKEIVEEFIKKNELVRK
jgi:1-phosphofructokinase family hexose kinase